MIFVIPAFKDLFSSFWRRPAGADMVVMAISDFFVQWWWAIFGAVGGSSSLLQAWKRSRKVQMFMDRVMLKLPIFGAVIDKKPPSRAGPATWPPCSPPACRWSKRWNRVGGASGNQVFVEATNKIRGEVSTGTALTAAMQNSGRFPNMVLQMAAIGESPGRSIPLLGKGGRFLRGRSG